MKLRIIFKLCLAYLILYSGLLKASNIPIDQPLVSQNPKAIAVVLVSPKGFGPSAFGHLFLRLLSNPKLPSPSDPVIEFAADSNGENYDLVKGLGFGKNLYRTDIKITSYREMMNEKAFIENRDLKNLILNIDEAQIKDILSAIQMSVKNGLPTYKFFSYNCTTAVAEVLAKGLGISTDDLKVILPTSIESVLKKKNLLLSEFIDVSGNTTKKKLFKAFNTKVKDLMPTENYFQVMHKNIRSEYFSERLLGYLKLRTIFTSTKSKEIKSLAFGLISQEPIATQKELFELFLDNVAPRWELLPLPKQNLQQTNIYTINDQEFNITNKNEVSLILKGKETPQPCRMATECSGYPNSFNIPLGPDFTVHNRRLHWKNIPVGQWTKSPGKGKLIHFGFHIVALFEDGKESGSETLETYLLFDFKNGVQKWIETKKRPVGQDILAISNQDAGGACGSLVELQHSLLKRAIFLPSMPRLKSNQEYLSLLALAIKGRLIFIPGFKNAYDLTSTIPKNELVSFLHKSLNEMSLIKKAFNAKKLKKSDDLEKIKSYLELGLYIPLILDLKDTFINHALLVVGYNEKDNDFIVYDPNFGFRPIKLTYKDNDIVYFSDYYDYKVKDVYTEFSDIVSELSIREQILNMNEASIQKYINETGRYSW